MKSGWSAPPLARHPINSNVAVRPEDEIFETYPERKPGTNSEFISRHKYRSDEQRFETRSAPVQHLPPTQIYWETERRGSGSSSENERWYLWMQEQLANRPVAVQGIFQCSHCCSGKFQIPAGVHVVFVRVCSRHVTRTGHECWWKLYIIVDDLRIFLGTDGSRA